MNGTVTTETLAEALAVLVEQNGLIVADEWLTVRQAVAEAKVSRTRLYEWMADGLPFLDERPRQVRRSALMAFKAEKEVAIVRGKKVPALRAEMESGNRDSGRGSARSARPANGRPRLAASRISGGTDRAALLALLSKSGKAA